MTRKTKSGTNWTARIVPVSNHPRYELERTIDALNGKLEWVEELGREDALVQERRFKQTPILLRKLVRAWQLSGPDLVRFSRDQRKMWEDTDAYWKELNLRNSLLLVGAPGGGAALIMNSGPELDPYKEALRLFIELLMNPECSRLAGPCARCDKFYLRRSARNKLYCSRSCGTRATATVATRKKRTEEHSDRLIRARKAAEEWATTHRTKQEWKPWVSARHPDITVKFLTRAVNSGELEPPKKGK